ncbi:MAG TPA: hypothetical protein VNW49_09565 [Puia sp.]|nr:hypothetical protein [Puia sp.]
MKNITDSGQLLIIITVFVVSRFILMLLGIHLDILALSAYWQYLDIETLRNHLLSGVWYDHAQPPLFNLFLGYVLKISGTHYILIFDIILKLISLCNALLLFIIVKRLSTVFYMPILVALLYILSPATIIFEAELFYTSLVSLFLLISVFYLIRFTESDRWLNAFGIFFPITLLCLTRSVYHMIWLFIIAATLIFYFRRKAALNKLILASLISILLVGSWYVKNKLLFGKLTASTWVGMNMARNVFHDNEVKDSSHIEAYEPFSRISVYRKFLDPEFENKFKGLNDRDLLQEMKNDSFINETEVSYIPVSELYQKASMDFIRNHPGSYAQNIIQSSILFFTPGTLYSLAVGKAGKIKIYDLLYSFNLTIFARDKKERRILLTISAMPKLILYVFVFFMLARISLQTRSITPWNLFILITIGFVFGVSSFFEHYENMRFRFETEPLFLILAAQVFSRIISQFQIRRSVPLRDLIA